MCTIALSALLRSLNYNARRHRAAWHVGCGEESVLRLTAFSTTQPSLECADDPSDDRCPSACDLTSTSRLRVNEATSALQRPAHPDGTSGLIPAQTRP